MECGSSIFFNNLYCNSRNLHSIQSIVGFCKLQQAFFIIVIIHGVFLCCRGRQQQQQFVFMVLLSLFILFPESIGWVLSYYYFILYFIMLFLVCIHFSSNYMTSQHNGTIRSRQGEMWALSLSSCPNIFFAYYFYAMWCDSKKLMYWNLLVMQVKVGGILGVESTN